MSVLIPCLNPLPVPTSSSSRCDRASPTVPRWSTSSPRRTTRYERALYAFALGITHSGTAAEDLVQESFLRLVREVQAGRAPDNVRAWLYRVCANLAASRGRRATVATRYLPFLASREVGETPEARHLRLELGAELTAALAGLSPDERTGLLLSAGGFHGVEIADIIGRTHGATRTMLTRARLKVQARLSAEVGRHA